MRSPPPRFARPTAFVLVFVGGLCLGWSGLLPNPLSAQPAGVQRTLVPFWQAWRLVEAHGRAGHTLVLASSATRFQVEPAARAMGPLPTV